MTRKAQNTTLLDTLIPKNLMNRFVALVLQLPAFVELGITNEPRRVGPKDLRDLLAQLGLIRTHTAAYPAAPGSRVRGERGGEVPRAVAPVLATLIHHRLLATDGATAPLALLLALLHALNESTSWKHLECLPERDLAEPGLAVWTPTLLDRVHPQQAPTACTAAGKDLAVILGSADGREARGAILTGEAALRAAQLSSHLARRPLTASGKLGGAGATATILPPYFEVDLNSPYGLTTLLSVINTSATVAVKVVICSILSVPVLDFNIYLTGYDVQSVNLRDNIIKGTGRLTLGPDGVGRVLARRDRLPQSPVAPVIKINFSSCQRVLPSPALLAVVLTGVRSAVLKGLCAGQALGDNISHGYFTMDNCTLRFQGDAVYFSAAGTDDLTNQNGTFAHIKADAANPETSTAGPYNFCCRYDSGTAVDSRELLATTFASASTENLAAGRVTLDAYQACGRLHVANKRAAGHAELTQYVADSAAPQQIQLALVFLNNDVWQLNAAIRAARQSAGELSPAAPVTGTDYAASDRLMFFKNDHHGLQVTSLRPGGFRDANAKNGTFTTLARFVARLGDGRQLARNSCKYHDIAYGSVTIHKSQGATVDWTYALTDPMMNRNTSYLALARHREGVQVENDRETFAANRKQSAGADSEVMRTGVQPFADRVREEACQVFAAASSWRVLELGLAELGYRLEWAARRSGLAVTDGRCRVPLSDVDRNLSGPKLAARFGETFREHRERFPEEARHCTAISELAGSGSLGKLLFGEEEGTEVVN